MAEEITPEIKDISYGSILFRHIDRILNLSNKEFVDDEAKLFTFKWSVQLLRTSIPDEIFNKSNKKNKEENNKEKEQVSKKPKSYKEQFQETQDLFSKCINLLATQGYLYKKVTDGEYDD
jgi:hypothetical protein